MLRLIHGGFGSGKSSRVLELIKKTLEGKDRYQKSVYLIVPEQDTVQAELKAAECLGASSALCFEVQNFSRLANTVFRSLGGLSYRYADNASKALCMWQSIKSLGGLLYEGGDAADESRVSRMLSIISELRASGIDTKKLEEAAEKLGEETPLGREMHDLNMLCTVYESTLRELYDDSEQDIDKLCVLLEGKKFFAGYDIYIDGFSSFTAPQLRLIGMLIGECNSVSITMPFCFGEEYLYGAEIQATKRKLEAMAGNLGVLVEYMDTGASKRSEYADLRCLADDLFREGAVKAECECTHVEIYECSDAREEAEAVSALIKKKIIETGARYRDIAVISRNTQSYEGILDNAFERHGIPGFFASYTKPDSHPLVKLIYCAFSIYCKNARRSDVIAYLKTGLCGIDRDDCDLFEKYVNTWRINGKRFFDGYDFKNSPAGYTDIKNPRFDEILARINGVKRQLTEQLSPFFCEISRDMTVKEFCTVSWGFLESVGAAEKIAEECADHESRGDEQSARESEGIYNCLVSVLDTMVSTVGEETVGAFEYLKLLRLCLHTKRVSVIPTSADAVTVGDAQMLRASDIKHAFIIGASEGSFPPAVRDNGYFDFVKRKKLSEVGLDIDYDAQLDASKELFYFARAALCASDSVTLTYSKSGQSSGKISHAAATLMKQAGIKKPTIFSELPVIERVYDTASAYEMALTADFEKSEDTLGMKALSSIASDAERADYTLEGALSPETARELFREKLAMTQARLESFAKCNFAFFCRYLLRLERNESFDFFASDIGNFVHAVLDSLTAELSSDGVFKGDIESSELDKKIEAAVSDYVMRVCPENDKRSARLLTLFSRIRRSVGVIASNICREFEQSRFVPAAHELMIKDNSPSNPAPLEFTLEQGARLSLYGTLDRADIYRAGNDVYVRVVDYKTGAKDFSMKDVERGMNLQLMIYLFTMCAQHESDFARSLGVGEGGRVIPAGMLYYSASVSDVRLNSYRAHEEIAAMAEKTLTRKGLLTENEGVLRAMEPSLEGKYIPVTMSSDTLKTGRGVKLLGDSEFEELKEQVEKVIVGIGNELCKGKIEARPSEYLGARMCENCEMRPVCRRYDADDTNTQDEEENE